MNILASLIPSNLRDSFGALNEAFQRAEDTICSIVGLPGDRPAQTRVAERGNLRAFHLPS